MWKKQKRWKKSSSKLKRKNDKVVSNVELNKIVSNVEPKNTEPVVLETRERHGSFLAQLAKNPRFVGAMRMMLPGCFASGTFIAILFAFSDLGRYYSEITYKIASFIPKNFIPPDTYIPGVLTMPVLLFIIAGFTVYGYRKGGTPLEIESNKDTRSFKEKLFEFIFFLIICLLIIFYRFREDYPEIGFIEAFSYPFFIILVIVIASGLFFYTFSRQQSPQYLMFVLLSALPVGFVLFLLGLVAHTLIKSFLYFLNQ